MPLKTTGSICFIDDSEEFLETLEFAAPSFGLPVRTFNSLNVALSYVRESASFAENRMVSIEEIAMLGTHSQRLDHAEAFLRQSHMNVFAEYLFVDYSMPEMNGIEFLDSCSSAMQARFIMSGFGGHDIKLNLKDGVLNGHLLKGQKGMLKAINEKLTRGFDTRSKKVASLLSEEMSGLFREQGNDLASSFAKMGVTDYLAVPGSDGVLTLKVKGEVAWLGIDELMASAH